MISCRRIVACAAVALVAFGLAATTRGEQTPSTTSAPATSQPAAKASKAATPKELLEKMHNVSQKMDTAAMVECMEPDAQKLMKDFVPVLDGMQKAMKEAAAAVEKKIGADEAKPLKAMSGQGEANSPLKAAVKDDKIDWSKVSIKEEGDTATFEVNGKKSDVELKKVDGAWYVAMPESQRPKADEVPKQTEKLKKLTAALQELTKKVNDGTITKDNFMEQFSKAMSGT